MENSSYKAGEIISNEKLIDDVYIMKIRGDFEGRPGQFYMVKSWDSYPLLSRPLSICDLDGDTISFLYLVVGKGTKMFSDLKEGEKIKLLGPLGNGFKLNEGKSAIVAGGIGLAPMKYLARSLDVNPDLYVGFKDKAYFIEEMEDLVGNIFISSDTGNVHTKGNVLDVYENKNYKTIYACGSNPMLNALKKVVDADSIQLSLEAHMACGIGACSGCTVMTDDGYKKVCHDGPIFEAREVRLDA